jgi:16S rRNA processing protein RimM
MMTDYLIVGRVLKPFGVGGEIKVEPFTERAERFRDLSFVFIRKGEGYEKIDIERARVHGAHVCLKPTALNSREEAAALAGETLYIDKAHAAPVEEGSHYVFDLVGCSVRTTGGSTLGILRDVLNAGSCDVYVVNPDGEKGGRGEILIPAISDVVKKIDVQAKEIVIEPIEGLL